MPWMESGAMDQRMRFIVECDLKDLSMAELCRKYNISRKSGYKWRARVGEQGVEGIKDRSRAPHCHPNQVSAQIEQAILAMRAAHPTWGPKKLLRRLEDQDPAGGWPARSTIAELLRRRGLAVPRRRRRHVPPHEQPFAACGGPNAVWCVDFKGWFRTADGQRCDPLTITDAFSRYLIRCQGTQDTGVEGVGPLFEAAFRQWGLPWAIRSDNGSPFATGGVGGLSRLSVWWIKLGIRPERIKPGRPQQNGRHERMHLTLKRETASPPAETLRAQQARFDAFGREFNFERPHEALGLATPASLYTGSPRPYPSRLAEMTYPSEWIARVVRPCGQVRFKGSQFFLGQALIGELVGLCPLDGRYWRAYFGPVSLGIYDAASGRMLRPPEIRRAALTVPALAGKPPSAALQEASQQGAKVLPMCLD